MLQSLNPEEELKKLQEELLYQQGFLVTVMKKLGNESFVSNAPQKVVDSERKKKSDAEARLLVLTEQMNSLKK